MKTIVLGTRSSDENFNGDCDFAFVKVDKEYAQTLLDLHAKFMEIKKGYGPDTIRGGLFAMEFFDRNLSMFSAGAWEPAEDVELPDGSHLYSIVDREWEAPEDSHQSIGCRTVHVMEDGFLWEASPKHTDIWIETATVTVEDMKKLAA